MKSTRVAASFLAFLLTGAAVAQPQAEASGKPVPGRRLALVIGNQNYGKLRPLPAVPEEVELMQKALKVADFKVTAANNLTLDNLAKVLDDFSASVQPGDTCFFYFSGYAAHDAEDDFLIPIDFDPSAGNLHNRAYPLTTFATNLDANKPSLKMFFLEAARKIEANMPDARQGLLIPYTGDLTEVVFGIPTGVGQTINTPPDQVGLFTAALAQMINRKGLRITELMPAVLNAVMEKSPAQQPAQGIKVSRSDFYFLPPEPVAPVHTTELPPVPRQNRTDREFYAWIPPGKFLMGCVPSDTKCDKNEKPQHEVNLSKGFWMGQNEVRVASYRRFLLANQGNKKLKMPPAPWWDKKWALDDHPISGMSWEDAGAYCSWAGGRLPTEAEWEYAARGGKQNQIYMESENAQGKANSSGQVGNKLFANTAPVRSFDPNGYGLYDMEGNVWEFVSDWYSADYFASSPATDPPGPPSGKQHVRRGGSFYSDPKQHLRLSIRQPSNAENNVGFRCVVDDTPETKRILPNP